MKKTLRAIVLIMAGLLVLAALTSCGKSLDTIEKKATDAGYEVNKVELEEAVDGVVATMTITGDGLLEAATVVEYESADAAKEAYDEAEASLEALGEITGYDAKRSGKVVIIGSSSIIEKVW